ncbi:MAG: hypothetical protein ABIK19_05440, partial [candidate division WOR-3 bacterium]
MKKYLYFSAIIIILTIQWLTADIAQIPKEKKESVIRIEISNHDQVYYLQDKFSLAIIDAQDKYLDAYADRMATER